AATHFASTSRALGDPRAARGDPHARFARRAVPTAVALAAAVERVPLSGEARAVRDLAAVSARRAWIGRNAVATKRGDPRRSGCSAARRRRARARGLDQRGA